MAAEKALDVALDLAEKHRANIKRLHVLLRAKEPHELLRLSGLTADVDVVNQLRDLEEGPKTLRSVEDLMGAPNAQERPAPDTLPGRFCNARIKKS